jgi:putative ABC transport system substrate-binding protein
MRRRDFISLLGGAAAWPLAARAQQPQQMRHIGVLMGGSESDPVPQHFVALFLRELTKLGWTEGHDLRLDIRFAVATEQSQIAAAELVSLAPEVIYASGGAPTRAARRQTQIIPIVFVGPSTVAADINIARPEGNITGFPFIYPPIAGKWVELLKETDPRVTKVALVSSPDTAGPGAAGNSYVPFVREAAAALGISLTLVEFQRSADLERAIDEFATEPNGGLIIQPGTGTSTRESKDLLRKLAARYQLPVMHWDSNYPAEGGLMSYASSFEDLQGRAASYVDRILRGAKVSELPIERPTKFELIINLKTAKALGLIVPPALLARADEVIE